MLSFASVTPGPSVKTITRTRQLPLDLIQCGEEAGGVGRVHEAGKGQHQKAQVPQRPEMVKEEPEPEFGMTVGDNHCHPIP